MFGAQRTKYMGFDEVPKREGRRFFSGWVNQWSKMRGTIHLWIGATHYPRA